MASKTRDSAPGPDGIPYSGWARARDLGLRPLYKLYEHILEHGTCHESFNHGLNIFLAKGSEEDAIQLVSRSPRGHETPHDVVYCQQARLSSAKPTPQCSLSGYMYS